MEDSFPIRQSCPTKDNAVPHAEVRDYLTSMKCSEEVGDREKSIRTTFSRLKISNCNVIDDILAGKTLLVFGKQKYIPPRFNIASQKMDQKEGRALLANCPNTGHITAFNMRG